MRNHSTESLALTLPCAGVAATTLAHPTQVGFLAVQDAVIGGPRLAEPRNNQINVGIQQTADAYGVSGFAAQVSPVGGALAMPSVKARGVPPRGRPV